MFAPPTYAHRRRTLCRTLRDESGLVLFLGNEESAMNAAANPYPFRQDSTFLYYFGLDVPGLDAVLDLDDGEARLFGDDPSLDDIVWMGDHPSLRDRAERAGVDRTAPRSALSETLANALKQDRPLHLLPPYRPRHRQRLRTLLGDARDDVEAYVSAPVLDAIVTQRSVKSEAEVEQLEAALDTTAHMHEAAFERAAPGTSERAIAGRLAGIAEAKGRGLSFRPTCSIRGEVLHNHDYSHSLSANDLLLVDAGGTSPLHYAGDITRVVPVGGPFTDRQRRLYNAVLDAQTTALNAIEPGTSFIEIHRHACRVLTNHLIEIGLMNGPVDAAVNAGAHALFFPHGLGHMLGLDVHDMENLGENRVGYAEDQSRSDQFGLHTLRLARPLAPGFVLTVEPGLYFIPALFSQWRDEHRHAEYINYERTEAFMDIGGIRIEDDVLVTNDGARRLGPEIPKTVSAVEAQAGAS
ncbi:MAG: Xaa-Pro aminopeptidase [Bacteroidetes bacterium SW_9_63_38]|nr:MAG: Xaa-Pro aminopeptidase [Bacteroidetes bacterium SW_9_63_38]